MTQPAEQTRGFEARPAITCPIDAAADPPHHSLTQAGLPSSVGVVGLSECFQRALKLKNALSVKY